MNDSIEIIPVTHLEVKALRKNRGQIEGVPANPRTIAAEDIERLKASLSEHPRMLDARPLLVYQLDDTYVVLAGNQRLRAARMLGWKTIPAKIIPSETSIEQLRRITLLDNSEAGTWDESLLGEGWLDSIKFQTGLEKWEADEVSPREGGEATTTKNDASGAPLAVKCAPEERDQINAGIAAYIKEHRAQCLDVLGNKNKNANALYLIVQQWEERKR